MAATTEYDQDCFIYVPAVRDAEFSGQLAAAEEVAQDSSAPSHFQLTECWVKIPLGEQIIVYARSWGETDELISHPGFLGE